MGGTKYVYLPGWSVNWIVADCLYTDGTGVDMRCYPAASMGRGFAWRAAGTHEVRYLMGKSKVFIRPR